MPRKREPTDLNGEKPLLNIFILSQFLLIFVIGDEIEETTEEGHICASRDSMNIYCELYLDIFDILKDVSLFYLMLFSYRIHLVFQVDKLQGSVKVIRDKYLY